MVNTTKFLSFDRILLAPSSASSYILGSILIQIPVMIGQTIILFLSSLILGFNPQGDLLLAFFIALSIFPFCLFLVFISTAFLSNEDVVGNVLGFGAPFLAFMSGAFIEVPKFILIPQIFPTASGYPRDFQLWDLLPITHTVNALRQVLLYDFDFYLVMPDILMSLFLSIPFFNLRFMTRGERPFGEKMSILDRLLSHDDKISYVMCAIEQEKIGVFSLFDLAFVFEFVEEGGIG